MGFARGLCAVRNILIVNSTFWSLTDEFMLSLAHSNSAIFILLPEVAEKNSWQHIAKLEISVSLQRHFCEWNPFQDDFKVESVSMLPSGAYDVREILAYQAAEDIV